MADSALTTVVRQLGADLIRETETRVAAIWRSLEDLSDEAADLAVSQVVPTVDGAQRMTAAIHTSYLNRVTGIVMNVPEVAVLIAEAPWNRSPVLQARRLMSEGLSIAAALEQAAARAAQVHSGDVLRARNDATSALGAGMEDLRPVRWAKTPNPAACEWCRLVSTQLYTRPDGLPAHLNDRCGLNAVTPAEAGAYTNASTVFTNTRWRPSVSSAEIAAAQRATAAAAADLAAAATRSMFSQAA